MPCATSQTRGRGHVRRYRVQKHHGKPFRVAVVAKAGPRGGHTVEWPEESHHSSGHHNAHHHSGHRRRRKQSLLNWFFTGRVKF